jgi:hypothetical protein
LRFGTGYCNPVWHATAHTRHPAGWKNAGRMPPNPLYAECVTRAAELLGGMDRLARELYLNQRVLARWIDGRSILLPAYFCGWSTYC